MDNIERSQPHVRYLQAPSLLRYAKGEFADLSAEQGAWFAEPRAGRGVAAGDLDNDGDLDLVVSNLDGEGYVARNVLQAGGWIGFDLGGAIGAQVEIELSGGRKLAGMVRPTGSYLSSSDPRVLFRLPESPEGVEALVTWPIGTRQGVGPVATGRFPPIRAK